MSIHKIAQILEAGADWLNLHIV